jgi:hypothetical protein
MQELREAALDVVQNMTCTNVYFEKLTGVNFYKFENFAHGFTNPKSETIDRYKDAVQVMKKVWSGEFTPREVFDRFYIENMNTQEIAISLNIAEHVVVRCMRNHPKVRKMALVRRGKAA